MYSYDALKRAINSPEYTAKAIYHYHFLRQDINIIKKKLENQFTEEEMARYAHGASVGLKEVVLYALIRRYKPTLMIETGVAQGVSTYFILKAMHDNNKGLLISIDYPNRNPDGYKDLGDKQDNVYIPTHLEPGWLVPNSLRSRWEFHEGKSSDILPKLNKKKGKSIEAFFHDSDHSYSNMQFELAWAITHMKKGIIIADDTSRNYAWNDFNRIWKNRIRRISSPISAIEVK